VTRDELHSSLRDKNRYIYNNNNNKREAHPVPGITFTTLDKSDYIKERPYSN